MSRLALAIAAGLAVLGASACATAQEPAQPNTAAEQFVGLCAMCHRGNGMAVGLLARRMPADQAVLENRSDLTTDYVTAVVRHGVSNMPPLSRAEVSDDALAAIAAYLAAGPHEMEENGR